jgi:hypothetical protein
MLSRRRLLRAGGVFVIGAAHTSAVSRAADVPDNDTLPPLPGDQVAFSGSPDFFSPDLNPEQLGTAEPTDIEKETAVEIIAHAPKGVEPYKVAMFFRDIGQGVFGPKWQPYARGWPVRYNPVIIEFFRATKTNPLARENDGDNTAWCAAFVNWCIARGLSRDGSISDATLRNGTGSASSGSFRCWESEAARPSSIGPPPVLDGRPQLGDIIVWAQNGTVRPCQPGKLQVGSGHVAFYLGSGGNGGLLEVGGNQHEVGHSAVTRKSEPGSFGNVRLLTIRTAPFLR